MNEPTNPKLQAFFQRPLGNSSLISASPAISGNSRWANSLTVAFIALCSSVNPKSIKSLL
jgi:hypothetical protein